MELADELARCGCDCAPARFRELLLGEWRSYCPFDEGGALLGNAGVVVRFWARVRSRLACPGLPLDLLVRELTAAVRPAPEAPAADPADGSPTPLEPPEVIRP